MSAPERPADRAAEIARAWEREEPGLPVGSIGILTRIWQAAKLGIDPVLVTCDDDNTGSMKVIEANGGVFEDQRGVKLRYWIPAS